MSGSNHNGANHIRGLGQVGPIRLAQGTHDSSLIGLRDSAPGSLSHTSGGANTDAVYWSVRTGDLSGKATVTRRGAGVRHRFPCNTPPYLWSRQV